MRKLIAGMKISLDGKMQGPDGAADWVEAWSEDYGLMPQIGACLLGAGMYPGYEHYWTAIGNDPQTPCLDHRQAAHASEIEITRSPLGLALRAGRTRLTSALWPSRRPFVSNA